MWIFVDNWLLIAALLAGMVGMLELGRWLGARRLRSDPTWDSRGVAAMESTVLALLGLLLAFSFSGAWSRFDARRELILKEANAIGTAWLRLDLVASPQREKLQESFRRYTDLRLAQTKVSAVKPDAALAEVQQAIWSEAILAARLASDGRVAQTLLPALNDMFDVATSRYVAVQTHPPDLVFGMLLVNLLLASILAGYGMAGSKRRHWLHFTCFVLSLVLAIYVTLDLEYPRHGFIRADVFDHLLVEVRAGMK